MKATGIISALKTLKAKIVVGASLAMTALMSAPLAAFGATTTTSTTAATTTNNTTETGIQAAVNPTIDLLNQFTIPIISVVTAAGTLYCIVLGVKFAKAEEPQDREKAKAHLKNAIIGFVLIFVLMVTLNLLKDPLINWMQSNMNTK